MQCFKRQTRTRSFCLPGCPKKGLLEASTVPNQNVITSNVIQTPKTMKSLVPSSSFFKLRKLTVIMIYPTPHPTKHLECFFKVSWIVSNGILWMRPLFLNTQSRSCEKSRHFHILCIFTSSRHGCLGSAWDMWSHKSQWITQSYGPYADMSKYWLSQHSEMTSWKTASQVVQYIPCIYTWFVICFAS